MNSIIEQRRSLLNLRHAQCRKSHYNFKGWDKERDSNLYPMLRDDFIPLPGRIQSLLQAGLK